MKISRFIKFTALTGVLALAVCPFLAQSVSYAKESLSPAIEILSSDAVFFKNGVKNSSVGFTADEFDEALGAARISSITLLVLPDENEGILMLGKVPALANQIIPRSKLSDLTFVPKGSSVDSAEFVFGCISSGYPRVISCNIKFSETLNFSPSARPSALFAYPGVPMTGRLAASDPDGDKMTFVVVSKPSLGTLTLKDSDSGEFVYTPRDTSLGTDSFSYCAIDKYGNKSETVSVTLKVKNAPDINYADVSKDFEHCALTLAEKNIFVGRKVGKYSYFEPTEGVSYKEFAIMAMSASGVLLPDSDENVFSVLAGVSGEVLNEDGVITVSAALDIAEDICSKALHVSDIAEGALTRESAAKIIYAMIG